MGHKLLTSPGVADTYTFLINTWNTLPESYQQRVYKNTLATVKHQMQQAENTTPAVVISVEAGCVGNAILLVYLTSEVVLEEPEIRSTDPNIPMDNNWTDDKLHFGMTGGSGDYEDEGDESDEHNAIPTTSWREQPATELKRFALGTSYDDGYEGKDGDNADADEEKEASQSDDGSMRNDENGGHSTIDLWTSNVDRYECNNGDHADMHEGEDALEADNGSTQNVEDWGHSTRECEDWTVYFRHVKYDNSEATARASHVSEAKTVLQYVTKSQSSIWMRVWHVVIGRRKA